MLRRFLERVHEPIVTDRGLDVASIIQWTIYAAWGIVSTVAQIPTLAKVTPDAYGIVWGAAIGVTMLIAAGAAASTFFGGPGRIRTKRVELFALVLAIFIIAVYPILLVVQAFVLGDVNRWALAVLSLSYLVFPLFRTRHLVKRIRSLRAATNG